MPKILKYCAERGCAIKVEVPADRCPVHARAPWSSTHNGTRRQRGAKLQARRARLFSHSPLCVQCQQEGRITAATIRDHIIPLAEGGPDDETNEQALCQACHQLKTQAEALRGRGR